MGCMLISANEVIRSNDGVEIVTIHVVWTTCYLSDWYVGYATILIWMICKICYCTNRAYRLSRGVVNSILVVQWAKRSFFYYHRFSFRGKSLKTSFSSQPTYIEREEIESQSHPKPSRLEKVEIFDATWVGKGIVQEESPNTIQLIVSLQMFLSK